MKTVVVGSHNPVKLNAVKIAFGKMFPKEEFSFEAYSIPSGVSDQPMSYKETKEGAINRAKNGKDMYPEAHYWVGLEGGIEETEQGMETFAFMAVLNHKNYMSTAHTSSCALPPKVAQIVKSGKELGHAMDEVFKEDNSKQKQGAVGILCHGVMDRTSFYVSAMVPALVPFVNPKLYT